jgi:hypothetical protein
MENKLKLVDMTQSEKDTIDTLRDKGFGVAIWSPYVLQGADPDNVADIGYERGCAAIEDLKDEE